KYPLSSINCATAEIASFGNMLHRVKVFTLNCQLTLAEEIDDGIGLDGGSEESEDVAKATNSEGESDFSVKPPPIKHVHRFFTSSPTADGDSVRVSELRLPLWNARFSCIYGPCVPFFLPLMA
ncbi:hypothetical protein U1Q18_036751, partial [Sarracenia purpurea var. burkii]